VMTPPPACMVAWLRVDVCRDMTRGLSASLNRQFVNYYQKYQISKMIAPMNESTFLSNLAMIQAASLIR
ncbi:hypothetical protein, partial [Curvibacter delicatus]|uniref:hypothetical protein n=1 Tax=Curvibacter delicatus TaxID=80879 RepID=UPI001C3FCA9D